MTAVDTSVAVAALAGWHEAHEQARRTAAGAAIPAHARLETYSVLTRLPPPHRLDSDVVAELVSRWFPPDATLAPSARLTRSIVERCAGLGLAGGAVYDALVGLTAAEAGETLATRDERAARTYELVDVAFQLLR
ncbi:MAG: PIN domain-containing protein [Gaiellaceae bacterium]